MFIALFLIGTIWCWFHFGLFPAVLGAVGVSLFCFFWNKILSAALLLASVIVLLQLETSFSHVLSREFQHQEQTLIVCIVEPISEYGDYISGLGKVVAQFEQLSLRYVRFSIAKPIGDINLSPGQCLHGEFRLRQPLGRIIPGGFHADSYYFANQIDGFAALRSLTETADLQTMPIRLFESRKPIFSSPTYSGVWSALALGWSRSIEPDVKRLLLENQIMHLFVVSGMHVGFVLLTSIGFIRLVLRPFSRFVHLSFAVQAGIAGLILLAYLWLLGFPVPATRAAIMTMLPLLIHLLRLNVHWWTGLSMACVVICLWQPAAWLTIGTWLSFISVLFIIILFRWRLISKRNWFVGFVVFQVFMSSVLLPWSLVFGFELNPLSVLVNIVATPVIAFFLLPLSMAIVFIPAGFFISVFEHAIHWMMTPLSWFSAFHIEPSWLPLNIILVSVIFLAVILWFRHRMLALLISTMSLLVVAAVYIVGPVQKEQMTVFDVGHGQSILIETAGERWLYDTGGQISPELSVFEFYLARTVGKLDGVIASHSDIDHSGGLEFIVNSQPKVRAVSGQPERHLSSEIANCHEISLLAPTLRFIPTPHSLQTTDNDASCVLIYSYNGHRIIITGDAGRNVEYYLLQTYPDLFPFDAVVVGHHGSHTSSAEQWLQANKSAHFLVSTSDRARPKWPSAQFLKWFDRHSLSFLSTAEVGTFVIDIKSGTLKVKTGVSAFRLRLLKP